VSRSGRGFKAGAVSGRRWLRVLLWLPVALLLFWTLRGIPLRDTGRILAGLTPGRLAALAAVNLAFAAALTLRWVSVLHGLGERISLRTLPPLAAARLAGFAVSYLTPGPQFGGEPVQLSMAHRRTGLPYARGTASLVIEKGFDLAGNLAFIGFGTLALRSLPFAAGGSGSQWTFLSAAGILLGILPLLYLGLVFAGFRPLSAAMARAIRRPRARPRLIRLAGFIREAETDVGLYGKKPVRAAAQLVISFLAIQGLGILELWLTMKFLGSPIGFSNTVLLLAGSKLALYAPLPGGLGALEAVQRTLLVSLGYEPSLALALSIWVRIRDIVFALAGLAMAASASRRPQKLT
jgi:uncharacterized protein (TIRG00374 family)